MIRGSITLSLRQLLLMTQSVARLSRRTRSRGEHLNTSSGPSYQKLGRLTLSPAFLGQEKVRLQSVAGVSVGRMTKGKIDLHTQPVLEVKWSEWAEEELEDGSSVLMIAFTDR